MKFLAFAAVAAAFVIPDARVANELVLDDGSHPDAPVSLFHEAVDSAKTSVGKGLDAVDSWVREGLARAEGLVDSEEGDLLDWPQARETLSNLTIYELISASNHTTQFAALVDQYPDLVARLNSTAANYTLFVPVDAAFAKLPGGAINETGAALEAVVRYHVGLDAYPYSRMFATHTIASDYNETLLGGEPQRLRARFEKHSLRVNFYSQVVAPNFIAANGVIHAIDTVVVPPTFAGRELTLAPARFSTYLLAMEKTGFVELMHGLVLTGSTLLAPSNVAFAKLGASINAFLFNTPRGLLYLEALLKYTIVPNATVYSDAYYGPAGLVDVLPAPPFAPVRRLHYTLPTLLAQNATVGLNVTTYPGYTSMLVNHVAAVAVEDGVAKNGVIQELASVPFPPLPMPNGTDGGSGFPWWDYKTVVTVEDLIERLAPYVDETKGGGEGDDVPEMSEL